MADNCENLANTITRILIDKDSHMLIFLFVERLE